LCTSFDIFLSFADKLVHIVNFSPAKEVWVVQLFWSEISLTIAEKKYLVWQQVQFFLPHNTTGVFFFY
jgi:hypothetical protein